MAITKNGAAASTSATNTNTLTNTFTLGGTTQSNVLLLLHLATTSKTTGTVAVTTITDDDGNTWHLLYKRYENTWDTGVFAGGEVASGIEVWYTLAASVDTDLAVTVNWDGTFDSMCAILSPKFLGVDATHPFDLNANAMVGIYQPAVGRHDPSIAGISSDTAHIVGLYIYMLVGFSTAPHFAGAITFNGVAEAAEETTSSFGTNHTRSQMSIGAPVTSAYSSVGFTATSIEENNMAVSIILTADTQVVPGQQSRSWGLAIA